MEEKTSALEIIACTVLSGGTTLHGLKLISGRDSLPPITEHIGDFCLVSTPIYFSQGLSLIIEDFGRERNLPIIQRVGRYFTEFTTAATVAYFSLGESLLPQILPGTADPKDIAAVLSAGLSAYVIWKRNDSK